MSDSFTIDTSDFSRYVVTPLQELPRAVLRPARAAVQVNAQKVKESWREKLTGNEYAPRVPYSITYDTQVSGFTIEAEIGATKGTGRQGGVALLLEYGASTRKGGGKNLAPRGYGAAALQENLDDLEYGIGRALDDAVSAVGW